jgi:hypothetical protein
LEREGKIGHEKQEDGFYKFVKKWRKCTGV